MALTPIGLIRKFGKLLRGGVTPAQVFLGCLLGFLLGMVPGFNGTTLVLIVLLILLNANGGVAALGLAIGKVLCLLLAPVTFQVGYFLIHRAGLTGLFRAAGETPVLALMDLHYYCVAGGIALGLVGGVVFGLATGHLLRGARKAFAAVGDRSETVRRAGQNRIVKLLLRLVFGKQKGAMADLLGLKSSILRKSGIALCVAVVVIVVVAQVVLVDLFFADALRSGLSGAVGAEVDLDRADLSLFGKGLHIEGLQITDPDRPTHNLVQVKSLAGDVSVRDLLTRRLVISRLVVDEARSGVQRARPGQVFERPVKPAPELPDDDLSQYFEKAKEFRKYFEKLKEYLDKRDRTEKQPTPEEIATDKQRLRDRAVAEGYFALSAQELLGKSPAWLIRELEVNGLRLEQVPEPMNVRGENVSSAPELNDKPMKVVVTEAKTVRAAVAFDFTQPGGEHHLTLNTPPLPVGETLKLSDKAGLDVSQGKAAIQVADGVFTSDRIRNLPFTVLLTDLKAAARPGKGVLGLDAKTSEEALKHLTEIRLAGTLDGALDAPRLKLDEKAVLGALKDTLVKAGKAELANRADAQIKKLGSQLTEKVGGQVGKTVQGAAGGILGNVLPGLGPKKPDPNAPKPTPDKPKPKGLLDSLLK